MDPQKLAQLFTTIEKKSLDVDGVVVVRNGYIVAEAYYGSYQQDTRHRQYSCTKSFISALVGIAIEMGYLPAGVDQPVLECFPGQTFANPDPRKDALTLEHLLTMSAGLSWVEGDDVYRQMWQSGDWVKFVLDRRMVADPGAKFNYSSGSRMCCRASSSGGAAC
jgi:CubicO group peptidase (beta-lactamase class C family)